MARPDCLPNVDIAMAAATDDLVDLLAGRPSQESPTQVVHDNGSAQAADHAGERREHISPLLSWKHEMIRLSRHQGRIALGRIALPPRMFDLYRRAKQP